jgi:hypothetical protein
MRLSRRPEPFDSDEFIYKLKIDGCPPPRGDRITTDDDQERESERMGFRDWLEYRDFLPLTELPGGLKVKFDDIRACRYEDIRQDLSGIYAPTASTRVEIPTL